MREDREGRERRWRRLRTFVGVTGVAFAVTLGVVVGNRLSEEALGVLAGAVCGVGAAIPTSLIVVAVSRRQGEGRSTGRRGMRESDYEPEIHQPRHAYPPVVVVSPGNAQQRSRQSWNALPASLSAPMDRNFRVVGGASVDGEGLRYGDERRA
jgi:hypothetical protein